MPYILLTHEVVWYHGKGMILLYTIYQIVHVRLKHLHSSLFTISIHRVLKPVAIYEVAVTSSIGYFFQL